MTAQKSDFCKYDNEIYQIIGKTDWFAFNPSVFGLTPGRCSTAVGKGYWCGYEIKDLSLFISQINICTEDGMYPNVREVKAIDPGYEEYQLSDGRVHKVKKNYGCFIYDNLNYPFNFTGKYLIGTDRLHGAKYSNPGGIDRYWKYRKLLSIEFSEGNVISVCDVSDVGKRIWKLIEDNRNGIDDGDFLYEFNLEEQAENWIEESHWWIKKKGDKVDL